MNNHEDHLGPSTGTAESLSELPELPGRHVTREDATGAVLWETEHGPYSADEMRSYALAAIRMEREKNAATCDAVAALWGTFHRVAPAAAHDCAAAIRKG